MRELLVILALAQAPVDPPPPELDQAIANLPPHVWPGVTATRPDKRPRADTPSQNAVPPKDPATESVAALEKMDLLAAEYSDEARIAGLEGTVRLIAFIDANGKLKILRITESLGLGLDEKASEAALQMYGKNGPRPVYFHSDFLLPQKSSRWHLVSAAFFPPEGAVRPRFLSTIYPTGAGLTSGAAIDEGQIVAAVGRSAWASIGFNIDEQGRPTDFGSLYATDPLWSAQAIQLVRDWRFQPARLEGKPVTSRCVLGLTWGQRRMDAAQLLKVRSAILSGSSLTSGVRVK